MLLKRKLAVTILLVFLASWAGHLFFTFIKDLPPMRHSPPLLLVLLETAFQALLFCALWFLINRTTIRPLTILVKQLQNREESASSPALPWRTRTDEIGQLAGSLHSLFTKIRVQTEALKNLNVQLQNLSHKDGLTQINNRQRFNEYFFYEWKRLRREKKPLSLILCGLDFFRKYNELYGHQKGDKSLKLVARAVNNSVKRSSDLAARYSGDIFSVLLPNTHGQGALVVAEAIQENISSLKIESAASETPSWLTASLGIATVIPLRHHQAEELINMAWEALKKAKTEGRNRVVQDSHADQTEQIHGS